MTSIFFHGALLPDGWARDVCVSIADGRLESVISRDAPQRGDLRFNIGIPGRPNIHSHAFQRGMAQLTERRGPAADDFWTWREVMSRFLGRMTPEDVEAVAAQAYLKMLESGFTRFRQRSRQVAIPGRFCSSMIAPGRWRTADGLPRMRWGSNCGAARAHRAGLPAVPLP